VRAGVKSGSDRGVDTPQDGVIEAVELAGSARNWLLAVQWQPEDTAASDPAQQNLFGALVEAGKKRHSAVGMHDVGPWDG
jgi:gamma-glutamyl-gamma-aminobutyrate hydrolase PuuD